MVWGTYLEKNCLSSNGHLLDCGGVKMLARMIWGTFLEKDFLSSNEHFLHFGGSEPLPGWFGALMQ